jgi:hypothetical protein
LQFRPVGDQIEVGFQDLFLGQAARPALS